MFLHLRLIRAGQSFFTKGYCVNKIDRLSLFAQSSEDSNP